VVTWNLVTVSSPGSIPARSAQKYNKMTEERFAELWNEYIEPRIESGELVWNCSTQLSDALRFGTLIEGIEPLNQDWLWKLIEEGRHSEI
jgi:hypothetical protein